MYKFILASLIIIIPLRAQQMAIEEQASEQETYFHLLDAGVLAKVLVLAAANNEKKVSSLPERIAQTATRMVAPSAADVQRIINVYPAAMLTPGIRYRLLFAQGGLQKILYNLDHLFFLAPEWLSREALQLAVETELKDLAVDSATFSAEYKSRIQNLIRRSEVINEFNTRINEFNTRMNQINLQFIQQFTFDLQHIDKKTCVFILLLGIIILYHELYRAGRVL